MITDWIRNHKTFIFLLASILVLVILRAPALSEPAWYDDEGIHAGVAQQMSYGGELYVNGWDNKPPFIYLLNTVFIRSDNAEFLIRTTSLVFSIGLMILIYKIAKKVSTGRVLYLSIFASAILLGIPQMENNIANAENFFILFTALGIYFALKKKFLFTAIFYGLAIFTKAQPFFEFVSLMPIILIFLYQSKEKLSSIATKVFKMGILFVLPIAVTAFLYILSGNFTQFADSALLSNFKYVGEASEVTKFLFLTNSVFLRLLVLILVVSYISYRYFKGKASFDRAVMYVWISGALFGSVLSGRGYPHYLLESIAPFLCVVAMLLSGKILSRRILRNVLVLGILMYGFLMFFFQGKRFPEYLNYSQYYSKGYGYLLGNVYREAWNDFFNPKMNHMYDVASYIDLLTDDGSYVYYVDQSGWLYPLSHTRSATKYVAKYHIWHTANRTEEAFNEIEHNQPLYIVRHKEEWVFDRLQEYIDSNYTKTPYSDTLYEVWKRN